MRSSLLYLLCFVLLSGCQEDKTSTKESNPKDGAVDSIRIIDSENKSTQNVQTDHRPIQDINAFWKEFRSYIIKGDSSSLLRFVRFPVKVSGFHDLDPVLKVDRDKFYEIFTNHYLPAEIVLGDTMATNLDLIRNTDKFGSSTQTESPQRYRLGEMVFRQAEDGWKLDEIYVRTNELTK